MAQCSPTQQTFLPPVTGVGHFCSHLRVLPLPSTQRWDQASAKAGSSPPMHGRSAVLFLLLHCLTGIQLLEQLISVSNAQAKPSCACSLFVSCFSPALCQPWWETVLAAKPTATTGLDLPEALSRAVAQPAQPKVAVVAGGISPGGRAVCLPWALGMLA